MNKLHLKGVILCLLNEHRAGMWDTELAEKALSYYNHSSSYWRREVRATLTDLFSGALIEEIDNRLDKMNYFGPDKISIKFKLTAFGRRRMHQTGLTSLTCNLNH